MGDRVKSKIYSTARWQQMRRLAFGKSHLCMYCYRRPANQIDHLSGCPDDNDAENHIPACQSCHSSKTNRVDVVCRLIQVQSMDDALVYVARKSKHEFDVPPYVLDYFTPEQRAIYELLRTNSMTRPQGLINPGSIYDLRYVIAVNEVHRLTLSPKNKW